MESSLRNHAMVSLQNRQQQRQRVTVGGGTVATGGLGATLAAHHNNNQHHNQQQQQQQYFPPPIQPRQSNGFSYHSHPHEQPQPPHHHQQQHMHQHMQHRSSSRQHRFGSSSSLQHQHQQQQQPYQQQQHYSNSADHRSVGSYYSRESVGSSHNSSTVDEAYRKVGQVLSLRAHGGDLTLYNRPRRIAHIAATTQSGFLSYSDFVQQQQISSSAAAVVTNDPITVNAAADLSSSGTSRGSSVNRTTKVAKKRFNDHGDHHRHPGKHINGLDGQQQQQQQQQQHQKHGNIVRKMTLNAKELFRVWQSDHVKEKKNHKRSSTSTTKTTTTTITSTEAQIAAGDLSPHRRAFSEMGLDGSNHHHHNNNTSFPDHLVQNLSSRRPNSGPSSSTLSADSISFGNGNGSILNNNNGLLSAVIETASQTSSKTTSRNERGGGGGHNNDDDDNGSVRSKESRGSSSIATRSSVGTRNSMVGGMPPRGKCLTHPSEAMSNEGLDNADGNLIVHENDSIAVTRKQIHTLTKEKLHPVHHAEFRVQSLLGQGTFAQVFQCRHVQTGQLVAVKVIKNKPAYTRQAAVEIDVLRALTKPTENDTNHNGNSKSGDMAEQDSKWDFLVDMVCYFMYQGHLCLVFELLGLNLYEILKKRQFRGLPLMVVRKLVHQAVLGIKELAQKGIVHCDLKPENVLLVTDDDVDSVVTAGESKRLSSSLRSDCSLEKLSTSKTPPISTAAVATTGGNSQNSTSTSNTDNTTKKKTELQGKGPAMEESILTTTTMTLNKKPLTSIPSNNLPGEWEQEKQTKREAASSSPTHSDGANTTGTQGYSLAEQRIKLIDFGSACFEGQTSHTYIQSRFYRSPEVLIGLTYDSAIDMWSLGCVAAELFLGLPILPGIHEHDQLCRISEMIGDLPDWMLDQGSKSQKYFVKFVPAPTPPADRSSPPGRHLPQWRMKTQTEFIASLSQSEIKRKGGLEKLEKQTANRYFKRNRLADIIFHKGQIGGLHEEKEQLQLFIHFLYGLLDPDPWKRWTAFQAASHPFLTGNSSEGRHVESNAQVDKDENQANKVCGYYWRAPSDPAIYRRKLLNVQKIREKQQAARQRLNRHSNLRAQSSGSQSGLPEETTSSWTYVNDSLRGSQSRPEVCQMSSSYTEFGNGSAKQLGGDSSSVMSGQRPMISGPQSYSEAGPSGPFPGSFNEVDFAYALQRPGVVPMGESSVCSSVDPFMTGPVLNGNHQQQHHYSHTSNTMVGSYGSYRTPRSNPINEFPVSSRSFDEGEAAFPSTAISSPPQSHHGMISSSHESGAVGAPPAMAHNLPSPACNAPPAPTGIPGIVHHQQEALDGNMAAQLYLQQQHAALQQQQLLLQQQQAALAFQQQQLQAYGMNPVLSNANVGGNPVGGLNPQQFNILGSAPGMSTAALSVSGGYYYVSAADGTPMLMGTNPGMQGQTMQAPQFPGPFGPMLGQSPGLTSATAGGIMSQQLPNMTGIPGMVTVASGGMPAGMMAMAPLSNNNSNNPNFGSSPGVMYPHMNNGNIHNRNGNPYQQPLPPPS